MPSSHDPLDLGPLTLGGNVFGWTADRDDTFAVLDTYGDIGTFGETPEGLFMRDTRYLSLFDLGRWDLLIRTGLFDAMKEHGWYAVVSSETVTFRKSLQLWQRFDVQSRFIGHDDKAVFLEHRAVVDGEIYARVIVRSRMLRRTGGTVSNEELFAAVGKPEGVPEIDAWVHDWAAACALPPVRVKAPSVWG